jgi:hypothetical protein
MLTPELMFVGKARAYPRVELLKGGLLGYATALPGNIGHLFNGVSMVEALKLFFKK